MTANKFDYNQNDEITLLGAYVESAKSPAVDTNMIFDNTTYHHKLAASIYLSGQNFLANFFGSDDTAKCLAGRRNAQVLSDDAKRQQGSAANTKHYIQISIGDDACLFYNYESLDASLADVIVKEYKGA